MLVFLLLKLARENNAKNVGTMTFQNIEAFFRQLRGFESMVVIKIRGSKPNANFKATKIESIVRSA
jgi:hypothetical protein